MASMPNEFDDNDWLNAAGDNGSFEEEDTLEFVITSADEEEETTWEWDGRDWRHVA